MSSAEAGWGRGAIQRNRGWTHGVAVCGIFWFLVSASVLVSRFWFLVSSNGCRAENGCWDPSGFTTVNPYMGCRLVLTLIRARICAEGMVQGVLGISVSTIREALLGSPDLSPAVLSTRDHRGNNCALPRHALIPRVPLTDIIEHMFVYRQGEQASSVASGRVSRPRGRRYDWGRANRTPPAR